MSESLIDKLRNSDRLPSPPGTALRVLELCASDDVSATEISKVIGSDPALSSQILKFANSPMAGIGRTIGSIQQAVTLLGLRTVKTLSLGFSLVTSRTKLPDTAFDFDQYWRESLACAVCSKRLAGLGKTAPREDAFVAGLLANLGRMVLAIGVPKEYEAVLLEAEDNLEMLIAAEKSTFSTTHMELGADVLTQWHLPEQICDAVRSFRSVGDDPNNANPLPVCVFVAEGMARSLWVPEHPTEVDLRHAAALAEECFGLKDYSFEAFVDQTGAELSELGKILALPMERPPSLAELRARAHEQMLKLSLATQLENQVVRQQNESLKQRVRVDGLTGVGNRDAFDEHLAKEVERCSRSGNRIALIMLDIDHFKKFNDTHGHQAGDQVLRTVAQGMETCLRKADFVARYGGEEFAVIAPDADVRGADALAERIRQFIENNQALFDGHYLRVTASLGVAVWSGSDRELSPEALIKAADECLYQAKGDGRNQVKLTQIGVASGSAPKPVTTRA